MAVALGNALNARARRLVMALLPPFFLDCVVAIGSDDEQGKKQWVASGFLYGEFLERISDTEKRFRVYLVTNRHVVADVNKIYLRFNPEGAQAAREYDLPLRDSAGKLVWYGHPDADVDVVAIPINVALLRQHGMKLDWFNSDDHAVTCATAKELGITEGDGVFVLGFPMGLVGGDRNFVIVRQGIIARIRDTLAGGTKECLVDVSVFPGNSGGPVVTRPEITAIQGTKSQNKSYLLGMVKSYIPYRDVAISAQTRRPRIIFEENSGLTAVIPVDFIRDTVQGHIKSLEQQKKQSEPTSNTAQTQTDVSVKIEGDAGR
jgi:S1-C subfamily serine protease